MLEQKREHIWANPEHGSLTAQADPKICTLPPESRDNSASSIGKETFLSQCSRLVQVSPAAFHPRSWRMSGVPEGRAELVKPHVRRAAGGSVRGTQFTGAAVIQRRAQAAPGARNNSAPKGSPRRGQDVTCLTTVFLTKRVTTADCCHSPVAQISLQRLQN